MPSPFLKKTVTFEIQASPYYSTIKRATNLLKKVLTSKILTWFPPPISGVLLAWSKLKVDVESEITDEGFLKLKATVKFLLFEVMLGAQLKGVVTGKGTDYTPLLVHGIWNALLRKSPYIQNTNIGDVIEFYVMKLVVNDLGFLRFEGSTEIPKKTDEVESVEDLYSTNTILDDVNDEPKSNVDEGDLEVNVDEAERNVDEAERNVDEAERNVDEAEEEKSDEPGTIDFQADENSDEIQDGDGEDGSEVINFNLHENEVEDQSEDQIVQASQNEDLSSKELKRSLSVDSFSDERPRKKRK